QSRTESAPTTVLPGTVGADSVRDLADNAVGVMRPTGSPGASRFRITPNGPLSRLRGRVREGDGVRVREQARSYEEQCRSCFLDFQRNNRAYRNAPSEGRAKPALRRSCDMDVARAPMGYRDVPSGRASVAGEFVRGARLHRARMSGQAFLVTFCGGGLPPIDKSDSPEGAKQETSTHSVRRATPNPDVFFWGFRIRGNDDELHRPHRTPRRHGQRRITANGYSPYGRAQP
ncbi:hypothetical protein SAMN05216189_10861, partial [Pseudomonas delhiensis]